MWLFVFFRKYNISLLRLLIQTTLSNKPEGVVYVLNHPTINNIFCYNLLLIGLHPIYDEFVYPYSFKNNLLLKNKTHCFQYYLKITIIYEKKLHCSAALCL